MLFEYVHVIHFGKGFITVISLTYLPVSKIYFLSQNASRNVRSRIKLTFSITNSNAIPYYCELQLKKMRLVSMRIVVILSHIMITPSFAFL